jgi:hypothetical protein
MPVITYDVVKARDMTGFYKMARSGFLVESTAV